MDKHINQQEPGHHKEHAHHEEHEHHDGHEHHEQHDGHKNEDSNHGGHESHDHHAYSNVYYLLRQTARHYKVINNLKQLLMITDVIIMDKEVVSNALNSGFKDFEDSLQNFATMKNGEIDVILTRNLNDFSKSEIGVLTPESYIKSIISSR